MNHAPRDRSYRIVRAAVWTLVLAGAVLRLWQYAGGASLWVDELAIARTLIDRPLQSLLTEPLARDQVAPRGFLLLEKIIVTVRGPNDFAMRLLPLLASLASLVIFARLVPRVFVSMAAALAMALFATAIPLIDYSTQLKQYSLDVFASVLLLHVAMDLWPGDAPRRARVVAALTGAVIVWFSQAAVLVLCGLAAVLLIRSMRARSWRHIAPVIVVWALSSIAATVSGFLSMTPATRAYLHAFWRDGFMPLPLGTAVRELWPWRPLVLFFGSTGGIVTSTGVATLGYPFAPVFVLLAAAGFAALWRMRRDACALSLAPIVVTLVAAAAHQYPFAHRVVVFLIPNFLLAVAAIPEWIASLDRPAARSFAWTSALLIGAAGVAPVIRSPPVYRFEDIKQLLIVLHAQRRASDPIYVYYGAGSAATYYAGQSGFRDDDFDFGGCHRADTRAYLREIDAHRGRRVWLVMQHAIPLYRERDDILRYLDTIGTRRASIVVRSTFATFPTGASEAYLYDLTDLQRLRNANAETFPLEGPQTLDPAFPCGSSADPERRRPRRRTVLTNGRGTDIVSQIFSFRDSDQARSGSRTQKRRRTECACLIEMRFMTVVAL